MEKPRKWEWLRRIYGRTSKAEEAYTVGWERPKQLWGLLPEPIRNLVAVFVRHWVAVVVSLVVSTGSAVLQYLASVPAWLIWSVSSMMLLGSYAFVESILASRAQRSAAQAQKRAAELTVGQKAKLSNAVKVKTREEKLYEQWLRDAKVVIPRLPDDTFSVLAHLTKGARYFPINREGLELLESQNYIHRHRHVKVSGYRRGDSPRILFEIVTPITSIVVEDHARRCEERVRGALSDTKLDFSTVLRHFGPEDQIPAWPADMSDEIRDLHHLFEHLSSEDVLDMSRRDNVLEDFRIDEDHLEAVKKLVFQGEAPSRTVVTFDLSKVPARMSSGGWGGPAITTA